MSGGSSQDRVTKDFRPLQQQELTAGLGEGGRTRKCAIFPGRRSRAEESNCQNASSHQPLSTAAESLSTAAESPGTGSEGIQTAPPGT